MDIFSAIILLVVVFTVIALLIIAAHKTFLGKVAAIAVAGFIALVAASGCLAEDVDSKATIVGFDLKDGLAILVENDDKVVIWYAPLGMYDAQEGDVVPLRKTPWGDNFLYFYPDGVEVEIPVYSVRPVK